MLLGGLVDSPCVWGGDDAAAAAAGSLVVVGLCGMAGAAKLEPA